MEVYGTLDNFWETGTEGVLWAIEKAPSGLQKGASYDDLFILKEGDYLEIYDPDMLYAHKRHEVLWSGVIKKDTETNMVTNRNNPLHKQQQVSHYWVHWLQQDFDDHEQWCWLFVRGYPAKLVRNEVC